MKIFSSLLATAMVFFLLSGCEKKESPKENEKPKEEPKELIFSGKMTGRTNCKTNQPDAGVRSLTDFADTLSCVEFTFDSTTNKLFIKHINSAFNCCVDSIYCNISLSNDTIIIEEIVNLEFCNCMCLYDLDIELEGIAVQEYTFKFIEPHLGINPPLLFNADLSLQQQGSYCVTRKKYPWGY